MNKLFDHLTPSQIEAVNHIEGPLLVLAGPGSGKTRVITSRIANMIHQGVPAKNILALTFTNKAADEMKKRLETIVPGERVMACTFHKCCAMLLRKYASYLGLESNFTIYDTIDSRAAMSEVLQSGIVDSANLKVDAIMRWLGDAKNQLVPFQDFKARYPDPIEIAMEKIYPAYQDLLMRSNAVDFDDMLIHIVTLLKENPDVREELDRRFQYVLVDEYQDTNLAQYAIVRGLSITYPNLCATGDPDQSIYGWRGASIQNILNFERDFEDVTVVRLEQNYRSTKSILRVADTLIRKNKQRSHKELYTDNEEGSPVRFREFHDQRDESESIAQQIKYAIETGRYRPQDFAIFYRTNALSLNFETAFRSAGIPYQLVHSVEFFQRAEIKDVIAYLQLLMNEKNSVAFNRIVNRPARGIGNTTVRRLNEYALERGISPLQAAREVEQIETINKRSSTAVKKFVDFYEETAAHAHSSVEEILGFVLSLSGYQDHLKNSIAEADQSRLANVEELLSVARQFDEKYNGNEGLETFLEEVSLVSDTDDFEGEDDRVTLMTLHASKGLEFPVVYIIAVEEGLLPHEWNRNDAAKMEEERRLLFVGMTRAQKELTLTQAKYREFRGRRNMTIPSEFLMELPRSEMEIQRYQSSFSKTEPSRTMEWTDDYSQEAFSDESFEQEDTFDHEEFADDSREEDFIDEQPEESFSFSQVDLSGGAIRTASDMLGENDSSTESYPVEAFHQGMVVLHPQYGPGKIIALSGKGKKRTASVMFASGAGEKKFVLAASPLRPK